MLKKLFLLVLLCLMAACQQACSVNASGQGTASGGDATAASGMVCTPDAEGKLVCVPTSSAATKGGNSGSSSGANSSSVFK